MSAAGPGQPGVLARRMSSFQLWGLAVGMVISGEYFGWSYGWAHAGTLGFLVTTLLVALFYTTFIFSLTELSAAISQAGGPFVYALRALGPTWGFVAGWATLVEFVFAPPAIALSIGAYLNVQFPALEPRLLALAAYVVFLALNLAGVTLTATFELCVTLIAIFELCVFMGVVAPSFAWENFSQGGWAGANEFTWDALDGIFAAIPFAIWFFLAIEGAALAAEEVRAPERAIPRAFTAGIVTLLVLALGVMLGAGGVGDWRALADRNDPLPAAMKLVVGESSGWLHMLVWIGLFGLVASFHGIIMGYSRQIFAMARAGHLPRVLATLHPRRGTPHWAVLSGGAVGMLAICCDSYFSFAGQSLTALLVTLSVLGALVLYVLSMLSLFRLRRLEPELPRPYRAPFYPVFPAVALGLACAFFVAVAWSNPATALVFVLVGLSSICLFAFKRLR